jgi:nicotinate-nucleotide adenylyltransferase
LENGVEYQQDMLTKHTALLPTPKKLGVLGGTFNPVHLGHTTMAEFALDEFGLDRLVFIPTGHPPHKQDSMIASPEHRFNMLLYACDDMRMEVSRIELERAGYSYTVDTLQQLKAGYPGDTELYFVVGGDTLKDIINWREPQRVIQLCTFIAYPRDDIGFAQTQAHAAALEAMGGRVLLSKSICPAISSTEIRERAAMGLPLTGYVPPGVEEYIRTHRVYGGADA